MSFKKYARIPLISLAEGSFGDNGIVFKKAAGSGSKYQNDPVKIDIAAALKEVAAEYDISSDPHDYLFEAARAVTADVSNDNGDAFPRNELLRFDHRLGKAVYQTFILKPHQINHRADNPKTARGVVLDAHYNDSAPPLEVCPECDSRTAEAEGRDSSGIGCKKCGYPVKDEFVELLLAIDTKKDATFAAGVKSGALDSLSMGCSAGFTDCSICDNRARSTQQFCSHIKSGNKKKMFKTASGMRMAYEKCGEVIFTEISRVDQPADPTAKQREIFSVANLPMNVESEMLLMSSKINKLEAMVHSAQMQQISSPQVPFHNVAESIKWAESSIAKLKGENVRLANEKSSKLKSASDEGRPFYAWESAGYDNQIKANNQFVARLEDFSLKAKTLEASGQPWGKSLTRSMSRFFANKEAQQAPPEQGGVSQDIIDQIEPLKEMHPELSQILDQLIGQETQGLGTIDKLVEQEEAEDSKPITPAEIGMKVEESSGLPPLTSSAIIENAISAEMDLLLGSMKENNLKVNTKALKFANAYRDLEAAVTKSGNVKVSTKHGTLFVIRPDTKPVGKEAAQALGVEILTHIANYGLVNTVEKYKTVMGPRIAQVLEHHVEDFADGRKDGDKGPVTDDEEHDMDLKREKPAKSMVEKETTDRKDEVREKRDQSNSDVLEKHQPDHGDSLPAGYKKLTEGGEHDMNHERSKTRKDTLKDLVLDHKEAAAESKKPWEKDEKSDKCSECKCEPCKCDKKEAQLVELDRGTSLDERARFDDEGFSTVDVFDYADENSPYSLLRNSEVPSLYAILDNKGQVVVDTTPDMDAAIQQLHDTVGDPQDITPEPAAMECTAGDKCANPECPTHGKQAQDMAPPAPGGAPPPAAPAPGGAAPGGMPMMGSLTKTAADKYVSRMERLYANRVKQVTDSAAKKLELADKVASKKVSEKLMRTIKLAAKRQALNLEYSPLKAGMCDILIGELDIDAETFYPGMDPVTATRLVEATVDAVSDLYVESLVKRAYQLMAMNDEALASVEADVQNLRPVPLTVTASATRTATRDDVRQAALQGNMALAPSTTDSANISNVGNRDSIRTALGTTKVSRAGGRLTKK